MDRHFVRALRLSKHKCLELQLSAFGNFWHRLEVSVALRHWHHDHAGVSFSVQVLNLYFELSFYDDRHWDPVANRFYAYPEDGGWPEGAEPENLAYEIERAEKAGNPHGWDLARLKQKLRELKAAENRDYRE